MTVLDRQDLLLELAERLEHVLVLVVEAVWAQCGDHVLDFGEALIEGALVWPRGCASRCRGLLGLMFSWCHSVSCFVVLPDDDEDLGPSKSMMSSL